MANNAFSVGLTGGIGSGKSTVANMFAERGATVIDTDHIAHQLTSGSGAAMTAIRAQFGAAFIATDGAMDRPKMRQHIFGDHNAKRRLEAILHPLIYQAAIHSAAQANGDYVLFVVPLLIESDEWRKQVSRILVVDCPEETQVERVMKRNDLTAQQVRAIMATQAPRATRLSAADDVVVNDDSPAALASKVNDLHALYTLLALTSQTKLPEHL